MPCEHVSGGEFYAFDFELIRFYVSPFVYEFILCSSCFAWFFFHFTALLWNVNRKRKHNLLPKILNWLFLQFTFFMYFFFSLLLCSIHISWIVCYSESKKFFWFFISFLFFISNISCISVVANIKSMIEVWKKHIGLWAVFEEFN